MADTTEQTTERRAAKRVGTKKNTGFIDPGTLMRIKNLEMRARIIVQGFFNGMHRSPYHGFSVEFSEYRQYSPGDDLRYLDWRLYARTDRYYIKRFEDETNMRCYPLLDMSRSMGFGTLSYNKEEYAKTTAATFERGEKKVHLSRIFEWYGTDFVPRYGSVHDIPGVEGTQEAALNFIAAFSEEDTATWIHAGGYKVDYAQYNWTLNGS